MLKTPSGFAPVVTAEVHADPMAFVFRAGQLLVRVGDLALPDAREGLSLHGLQVEHFHPVGMWNARYCCATWVDAAVEPMPGYEFVALRSLFGAVDESLLGVAGRAAQLAEWARTHRYCGHCASPMQLASGERAFACPACGMVAYPRISPAMMVLIRKGNEILLARHTRSPNGRFSPLAGFLEAGESIEEAIHREVMEEVGLQVNNLQYFGSQSWPFPHSLMIAFIADYVAGDIVVDATEIAEARWFGSNDVQPESPSSVSISSLLVKENWPVALADRA